MYFLNISGKHKGLTLIEILIVLAILAILASVALPNGRRMLANRHIVATANALLSASEHARAEAVSKAQTVHLCPSDNGNGCGGADDWATGWITWIDVDGNNQLGGADQLLRTYEVGGGLTIDVPAAIANGYRFGSNGRPSFTQPVTITVCDERGAVGPARSIIFTLAGRGSVLSTTDAGITNCS